MNTPIGGERTFAEVIQDIIGNFQEMIRSEVRLAKAETKEEVTKATRAGTALISGGVLALYGLGFLLLTIVYALTLVLEPWAAALIVGGALMIIAVILINVGRNRLKRVHPVPERTIQTAKESVQWMRSQTR